MATPKAKPKAAKAQQASGPEKWPFGRKNYIWFGIAILVMILGYVALGQGSDTLAPFLLVVAYCVLIPTAILVRDKTATSADQPSEPGK